MSSILAWVREDNTTIGAYTFPGFQIYGADDLDGLVTTTCQTALARTIRCPTYLTMYMSPRVGQSTGNSTFTDLMCSSTCDSSLQSWYDDVSSSCANQTLDYADPTLLGGYTWQGYNETCLKDPSSGEYCTDVVVSFSDADTMESMPTDELYSWCWTQMVIMMQNSSYSAFNDYYQSGMQYMVSECSLSASITMPESLIYPRPTVTPMCLSDVNYTIQAGDTCDSIAIAYNVTSASILTNNPMFVNNCSSLIPGNTICMPLPCTPLYTLQPDDDCMTVEWKNGLRDGTLRQYNPCINYFCDNLQESTEILGSVLCLGPQAGKFVSNSSFLPNPPATSNPSTGYSMYVIDPPINATLANGTTTLCGSWYTVNEGDTCAQICSMESIPSSLFLACNPTLNSTNCDANLVVNTTYCVAPMINWDDPSFWVDDDTAPTTSSFKDDFSSGSMAQWMTYDGSFGASSGALVGSNSFGGKALINSNYGNFLYEVDVTLPSASGNAGLVFRVTNPSVGADAYNGYYAGISTSSVFVGRASNSWTPLGSAQVDLAINQLHHVKVEVVDTTLNIFVDDMNKVLVSVTDGTYTSGMNGVRVYGTEATFDNIQFNPLIFRDDFSSGTMGKWTTIDGQYQVSSNVAVLTASPAAKAVTTGVTSADIIYEAEISINSTPNGNGGMIFRVSNAAPGADTYNGYYVGIGIGYVVFGFADTNWNEIKRVDAADINAGQIYHLAIQTSGDSISIFVDDLNTPRMVVKDDK
ncbi:hypothetical protein TMatcc_001204 [Talaromyces marneffei ATCC 18224]|uniref:uncharacterized protein n=1 Tax=Talaromyces marneffei TaxID=37727 RepID=UPI0012A81BA3|nr:uncharacterized protein EYB26_003739 [Talaromyces marneffei]KAE8550127.1 hypothetical protein EYB25_008658 [Talaromyces marneffei]QGA16072.1 hypothetical protein EYB26_003739 [Talaromyces marneffei]